MFWLSSKIESMSSLSIKTETIYATDYSIWHQCMGHPGDDILQNLPDVVKGAPKSIMIPLAKKPCEACAKGKMQINHIIVTSDEAFPITPFGCKRYNQKIV